MDRSNKIGIATLGILLILTMSHPAFGFGSLSEFLSADGNTLRTSTILTTDITADPRWQTPGTISVKLCTGGTSYSSLPVNYAVDATTELLEDTNNAASTWNAVDGGPTFAAITADATCGPNNGSQGASLNGFNEILITNTLPPDVLGYTSLYYAVSDGTLTLIEADIAMSNNYLSTSSTERWKTSACFACVSPCPASCTTGGTKLSFEGVLVHEMGHLLGLSHTTVTDDNNSDGINTTPTMFPSVSNEANSLQMESLQTDDELSKKNLYQPDGFPNNTSEGSISGFVYDMDVQGVRGAHVYAFSLSTQTTIAGTFSGMNGTFSSTAGAWQINGIPFGEEFIVVIEPVDRPEVSSSLAYNVYNAPIYYALHTNLLGLRDFAIEAYPDARITDIRRYSSITSSPGIAAAQIFELTAETPGISNINFYISDSQDAPNDSETITISYPSSSTISNDNPLLITVSTSLGLEILDDPQIMLTAIRSEDAFDWTEGLSAFTASGNSRVLFVDPTRIRASNGSYTLLFTIQDPKFGDITSSKSITVNDWTLSPVTGDEAGGSGGCSLSDRGALSTHGIFIVFFALGFLLSFRRRLSENR